MRYPLQVGTGFHDYPVNVMPPMFVQYKEATGNDQERLDTIANFLDLDEKSKKRLEKYLQPDNIETLRSAWAETERARLKDRIRFFPTSNFKGIQKSICYHLFFES